MNQALLEKFRQEMRFLNIEDLRILRDCIEKVIQEKKVRL